MSIVVLKSEVAGASCERARRLLIVRSMASWPMEGGWVIMMPSGVKRELLVFELVRSVSRSLWCV